MTICTKVAMMQMAIKEYKYLYAKRINKIRINSAENIMIYDSVTYLKSREVAIMKSILTRKVY